MGFFDFLTKEGKFKTHVRRMSDAYALPEDRETAARALDEDGSPKALLALLTRFDVNISSQIKDQDEKDRLYQLLRRHGAEKLAEPVRAWLRRCRQYAWPLRLLADLEGEDAAAKMVYELLAGDAGKATFEPERRKHLLVWLSEHKHPGALAAVTPFLKDFDEEVRYAAAEVAISQEGDDAREALLARLADPKEESLRMKHRIAQVFRQRAWPVGDLATVPDGFAVRDGVVVSV